MARIKLGTASHHEDGCQSGSQSFTIGVPNIENLDHNYNSGPVTGIEVVVTNKNGDASFNNFRFTPDAKAVTFDLFAHGQGSWVGGPIGGGICIDAKGAWIGIDIFGYYK